LALAAEGAKVALAARRAERLEELVKRISKDGGQAMSIAADVSDEAQIREMVSKNPISTRASGHSG
jgi:NADP-dependent 3-hydroxy acid dehydrogenase YdfG